MKVLNTLSRSPPAWHACMTCFLLPKLSESNLRARRTPPEFIPKSQSLRVKVKTPTPHTHPKVQTQEPPGRQRVKRALCLGPSRSTPTELARLPPLRPQSLNTNSPATTPGGLKPAAARRRPHFWSRAQSRHPAHPPFQGDGKGPSDLPAGRAEPVQPSPMGSSEGALRRRPGAAPTPPQPRPAPTQPPPSGPGRRGTPSPRPPGSPGTPPRLARAGA